MKRDSGLRRNDEQSGSVGVPSPGFRIPRRMQVLHRLIEITGNNARQLVQAARDRIQHRFLVGLRRFAQYPWRDAILVSGMTDADAQTMKPTVPEVLEQIT